MNENNLLRDYYNKYVKRESDKEFEQLSSSELLYWSKTFGFAKYKCFIHYPDEVLKAAIGDITKAKKYINSLFVK